MACYGPTSSRLVDQLEAAAAPLHQLVQRQDADLACQHGQGLADVPHRVGLLRGHLHADNCLRLRFLACCRRHLAGACCCRLHIHVHTDVAGAALVLACGAWG